MKEIIGKTREMNRPGKSNFLHAKEEASRCINTVYYGIDNWGKVEEAFITSVLKAGEVLYESKKGFNK